MNPSKKREAGTSKPSPRRGPTMADLSDGELAALVQESPFLDPHSKRYWTAILAHLRPEDRQVLAAALLESGGGTAAKPDDDDARSAPSSDAAPRS